MGFVVRRIGGWIVACGLMLAQAPGPSAPVSSEFSGSASCRPCHPAQSIPFFRNPHFQTAVSSRWAEHERGCEGCHGPGAKHVAAGGGADSIGAFSRLDAKQASEVCLRCHAKDESRANFRRGVHLHGGAGCTSCHSIHQAGQPRRLLAKSQPAVCYPCHGEVRSQFAQPFKHRVEEGSVACSDCHNPHGGDTGGWKMGRHPRLAAVSAGDEAPCFKCHTEKRGPFLYEHGAVRVDGCGACHLPHGSANARLLKRPQTFPLCLECHNGAGSFGRQADGVALQSGFHNMADPRYRNCTTCHVRIHGSNADRTMLR